MPDDQLSRVQRLIAEECDRVKALLLAKNAQYGNSYVEPVSIFTKAPASERLAARIDEKLARIRNSKAEDDGEDTEQDLIGLLVMRRVVRLIECEPDHG